MHRLIAGTPSGLDTDHINRDKLDNRGANLRAVDRHTNQLNRPLQRNNTSGHVGVTWYKKRNNWIVQIKRYNKRHFVGYFNNLQDAIIARKKAEREYAQ